MLFALSYRQDMCSGHWPSFPQRVHGFLAAYGMPESYAIYPLRDPLRDPSEDPSATPFRQRLRCMHHVQYACITYTAVSLEQRSTMTVTETKPMTVRLDPDFHEAMKAKFWETAPKHKLSWNAWVITMLVSAMKKAK